MSINFCGALLRTSLPPAFNKSPAKGIKPKADNPAMPRFMAPEPKSPEPKSRKASRPYLTTSAPSIPKPCGVNPIASLPSKGTFSS